MAPLAVLTSKQTASSPGVVTRKCGSPNAVPLPHVYPPDVFMHTGVGSAQGQADEAYAPPAIQPAHSSISEQPEEEPLDVSTGAYGSDVELELDEYVAELELDAGAV